METQSHGGSEFLVRLRDWPPFYRPDAWGRTSLWLSPGHPHRGGSVENFESDVFCPPGFAKIDRFEKHFVKGRQE